MNTTREMRRMKVREGASVDWELEPLPNQIPFPKQQGRWTEGLVEARHLTSPFGFKFPKSTLLRRKPPIRGLRGGH